MSQDFRLWHAPKLASRKAANARLRKPTAKLAKAALVRIADLQSQLLASFATSGSLDNATGLLDISLPLDQPEALSHLLFLARPAGFVVYDPQTDLFHYPNGTSSLDEAAPNGIHEGVLVCLRELRGPLGSEREQRDCLDALDQFIHADSPDVPAAIALALPVLESLGESELPLANLYRRSAALLREELLAAED